MQPQKTRPWYAALALLLLPIFIALQTVPAHAQAQAQQGSIRKNLADNFPELERIDEISKSPMAGVFEIRVGVNVFYTDAKGEYLIQGELIDVRSKRNLTEERISKLTAIDFNTLPIKDALKIVRGDGKRKMAVFEDPNCGYCKRFEQGLEKIDNVTVYLFLYPILSPDSTEKSRNIWCAKDQITAWQDWMLRDKNPPAIACDSGAVQRNVAFGKKNKMNATPLVLFSDGTRVPGAISSQEIEKRLARIKG